MKRYNIYSGNHTGGTIDYSIPVGTVEGLQFTTDNLPVPSVTRFGLRVYDDLLGLEESNIDVTKTVIIDSLGRNVSDVPGPPIGLSATAGVGSVTIAWTYTHNPAFYDPTAFNLYVTPGTSVNYTTPATVVPAVGGRTSYTQVVSGLTGGTQYAVGVRCANGIAEESNTLFVLVTPKATAPAPPVDLTITLG